MFGKLSIYKSKTHHHIEVRTTRELQFYVCRYKSCGHVVFHVLTSRRAVNVTQRSKVMTSVSKTIQSIHRYTQLTSVSKTIQSIHRYTRLTSVSKTIQSIHRYTRLTSVSKTIQSMYRYTRLTSRQIKIAHTCYKTHIHDIVFLTPWQLDLLTSS